MTTVSIRYVGRIVSVPGNDGYGFIGINSVAQSDGSPHGLDTTADIFVHRDDCGSPLKVGMTVAFDAVPDQNRGDGFYRAMGAVEEAEVELVSTDETPMPGFLALAPFGAPVENSLVVSATPAQRKMKPVPPDLVEKALENAPAPTIPRDNSVPTNLDVLMPLFLQHLFPTMAQLGSDFRLDGDETEFRAKIAQAKEDHLALGMGDQIVLMDAEVERFVSFRSALHFMVRENLVRRDTIIPIEYLPDFFTAVPVWYFWADGAGIAESAAALVAEDPQVHPSTSYFCDLFPNQNWADMFQMFDRRFRTLRQYKGDIIPPHITRRIRETVKLFDYVVIMTPYHDVAGKDWTNLSWVRSIDPYVVGFKKGIPYFFILARFSDSGTFPLFTELVADTMSFLKSNVDKLDGFNAARSPFWHIANHDRTYGSSYNTGALGTHLQEVAGEALKAFEAGHLFDWLRGKPLLMGE